MTALDAIIAERLPALGHRNWIVVADAAFPWQIAAGIEVHVSETPLLEAAESVLSAIDRAAHVRAAVHLDLELDFVSEHNCDGIAAFRERLGRLLTGRQVFKVPHDEVLAMLDAAGRSYKVVFIKTPHFQPYTSVFIRLDCGYWPDKAERAMREAMAGLAAKGA